MKISTMSRYGMRAIIFIALKGEGKPVLAETIARQEHLSKKYLEHILASLRRAGIIRTIRGKGGGYVLSKVPEKITALEVIEALEGKMSLVGCVEDSSTCPRAMGCISRKVWKELSDTIVGKLSNITIDSLITNHRIN